jgi:hypothetical protein
MEAGDAVKRLAMYRKELASCSKVTFLETQIKSGHSSAYLHSIWIDPDS